MSRAHADGENSKTRILIGGIGNVLMGDDGVGPLVARLIESRYEFPSNVSVVDLGTPGLDLVVHLSHYDTAILVDAVDNGQAAGTLTLYDKSDIVRHGPPVRMDPHSPALAETLLLGDFSGEGPKEVALIGVTGQSYEFDTGLSAPVQASIDAIVTAVIAELVKLGVQTTLRTTQQDARIWWRQDIYCSREATTDR
jgi:hydrogenase maturation protease